MPLAMKTMKNQKHGSVNFLWVWGSALRPFGPLGAPLLNTVFNTGVETIGCYNDTSKHAIPTLERQDYMLDGNPGSRSEPIMKCYKAAKNRGYKVFALQDGGFCSSSDTAENTFNKYGISLNCKSDGEGGPLANQVYYIKGITV